MGACLEVTLKANCHKIVLKMSKLSETTMTSTMLPQAQLELTEMQQHKMIEARRRLLTRLKGTAASRRQIVSSLGLELLSCTRVRRKTSWFPETKLAPCVLYVSMGLEKGHVEDAALAAFS